ncbi:MAG: 4Fe-4S binding protein, partial [Methanomicrobiales archaeon]|nr:4Fe-4S binding protein [Methanomicrobiales archaeon]
MSIGSTPPRYKLQIDREQCMLCERCIESCPYGVFRRDGDRLIINSRKCTACHRCIAMCPRDAINLIEHPVDYRSHPVWTRDVREAIYNQARTGRILLSGMGNVGAYPIIFDQLVLDACQVTNPSIDPLREPMELRTYLGKRPLDLKLRRSEAGEVELLTEIAPNLQMETPIMIAHMSYGAISLNAQLSLARAALETGTFMGTGEGGLHQALYPFQKHIIVQVASGRFGVDINYLERGAAIEIKIGQGAKPGIGGHLPGEKVCADISCTRMIPEGSDAISPAPHHDIYSIEDLKQLVRSLKEATEWKKPVFVKIAAVHNAAAIAAGIARSSADAVVVDGFRGGTGAAPKVFRDHVGIPIEAAIASVDAKLRQQGIRNEVSLVASGGLRGSADVAKVIALGADAVYIGTAALVAMGCRVCGTCYRGLCPWGIATQRQ